jgi:hypothetical protein
MDPLDLPRGQFEWDPRVLRLMARRKGPRRSKCTTELSPEEIDTTELSLRYHGSVNPASMKHVHELSYNARIAADEKESRRREAEAQREALANLRRRSPSTIRTWECIGTDSSFPVNWNYVIQGFLVCMLLFVLFAPAP